MFEAPSFDLSLLPKEIRIRAGEPLDINLPLVGTPTPEVKWVKNDAEIQQTLTTRLESDDNHARLLIPSAKRSDAGNYLVTASNTYGKAEATVKVIVLDKPGEPEGPLEYPSTTHNSVSLKWKPPLEDGGQEIIGYRVEYCELGESHWQKVPELVSGTRTTVKGLDDGKQYLFRVRAENISGIGDPLVGRPVAAKDPFGKCFSTKLCGTDRLKLFTFRHPWCSHKSRSDCLQSHHCQS